MTDSEKSKKEPFGPDDNSMMARIWRGEIELEQDPNAEEEESPVYWETASIEKEDNRIIVVVDGTSKREYPSGSPDYDKVLATLKETFPQLAPGRICKLYRYSDGRTEIETVEYLDGKRVVFSEE